MGLSIVIPTYGRDEVLCDTIAHLLAQVDLADEIVVVDQTTAHGSGTQDFLTRSHATGAIRWLKHAPPGTVGAMNRGLLEARSDVVLFLDDDILPAADLVAAHRQVHQDCPEAWAVVGQVLQPEDWTGSTEPSAPTTTGLELSAVGPAHATRDSEPPCAVRRAPSLTQDLTFPFNGNRSAWVVNVMAGNLSVKRARAFAVGGFDANFTVPVAFRFETEFARRVVAAGGRIRFEPAASIKHLRAVRGGTRTQGSHLSSASPVHGVGDYYYALSCGHGWERLWYMVRRPFREVRTRFHLRYPWYIPVKLLGELRAMVLAVRLWRQGPKLLPTEHTGYTGSTGADDHEQTDS